MSGEERLHPDGGARLAAGLGTPSLPFAAASHEALRRADLEPATRHLAWELARLAPQESDREALLHLGALVLEAEARGSTRIEAPSARAVAALAVERLEVGRDLAARVGALALDETHPLISRDRRTPLIRDGGCLYTQRAHATEVRVAARLTARLAVARAPAADLAAEVTDAPVRLAARQRDAVRAALERRLAVIRGGPGTGKTAIAVAILRAWVRARPSEVAPSFEIALAAPTGKAADRMRASIEASLRALDPIDEVDSRLLAELPRPSTLHRVLGYSRALRGVRFHAGNPLGAALVIVDESSMVDLHLFDRLLDALDERAHLVLLGDADQLPSVAMGAVFRDLGAAPVAASIELTENHRMRPDRPAGLNILTVALAINDGRDPRVEPPGDDGLPPRPDAIGRLETLEHGLGGELGGVHLFEPERADVAAFLARYYEDRIRGPATLRALTRRTFCRDGTALLDAEPAEALFAYLDRGRLLTITRSPARPTGVESINALLHRRLAEERGAPAIEGRLMAGEPVLVATNDYERRLFNGDQGLVLWTAEGDASPRLSAVFRRDGGFVAHPLAAVRNALTLGYATTVHKAQGSEHDHVALVLPGTDSPRLLTREILYTAITRARRSVLIVGRPELLARGIGRTVARSSGLAARLRDAG